MSSSNLFRLSGAGLLIGGLLAISGDFAQTFDTQGPLSPGWIPSTLILLIGEMVLLLSLSGMFARQADKVGVLGLLGFVLFFLAELMAGIGRNILDVVIFPWILKGAPALIQAGPPFIDELFFLLGELLSTVGAILLCVATIRAGVFPRWAALLFIVGAVLNLAARTVLVEIPYPYLDNIALALIFIAFMWFGYALLSERSVKAVQPSFVATQSEAHV